jgi:hypothetical protein
MNDRSVTVRSNNKSGGFLQCNRHFHESRWKVALALPSTRRLASRCRRGEEGVGECYCSESCEVADEPISDGNTIMVTFGMQHSVPC